MAKNQTKKTSKKQTGGVVKGPNKSDTTAVAVSESVMSKEDAERLSKTSAATPAIINALETVDEHAPIKDIAEFVKAKKEEGATHEEVEDEFIKRGMSDGVYGSILDAAYSKKPENDGSNFLEGEGTNEPPKESEEAKAARLKEEEDKVLLQQKEEQRKNKQESLEADEKDLDPLKKSHELKDVIHDMSVETEKPNPIKYREKTPGGSSVSGYTIWHCPKCKAACEQHKGKWLCTSANCLYGKPKPLPESEVPQEIERYCLVVPELKANLRRIKMKYVGDGRYVIKEGQEEYIAKQIVRAMENKTWKKLTAAQIVYLAEWDKTKGF